MSKIKAIILLSAVFFAACSSSTSQISPTGDSASLNNAADTGGGGGGTENAPGDKFATLEQAQSSQETPAAVERKIIRNAELKLEVESPEAAQQKITEIAGSKKGYLVESQQSTSDVRSKSRDTVTITIRVPADKFEETLEEVRKNGGRLIDETVKSQDVTEEFIDIEATLKAKKSLEAQFLEIMKRSNTVEDALNVQRELANVRAEIEKIEGRMRFLENQTSFSTIKIRLQTPASVSVNSGGFFYRLTESISSGFDFAVSFMFGLITFLIAILPFVLFILLPIYLIMRYFWKRLRIRKTTFKPEEIVREEIKEE